MQYVYSFQNTQKPLPVYAGVGGFGTAPSPPPPFYAGPDPAAALLRALQEFVGVPVTGVWDRATHDAFSARSVAGGGDPLPPWGTATAADVDFTFRLTPEDLAGRTGPLPPDVARTAQLLGLPTDTYEGLRAHIMAHAAEMTAALDELERRVEAAEAAARSATTAETEKPTGMGSGLLIGGLLVLVVVGGVVLLGRK